MKLCVVIPTYNNAATLRDIVERTLAVCGDVIVVDDGSSDDSVARLQPLRERITLVGYPRNRGKGYALRRGFEEALRQGFDTAVTLDSDGQHSPEEIGRLTRAIEQTGPRAILVVGSRNLDAEGMPTGNSFANHFSNFWFVLQTWRRLPDTQTGFRLYPLRHLPNLRLLTHRYESELELLVFSAWKGVRLVPVSVGVSYPPDRVSHFRPFIDFFRIAVLNTFLCLLALVYGYPRMIVRKIKKGCTR